MEKFSKVLAIIGLIALIAAFIINDILIDFTIYFKIIQVVALVCFIFYFLVNFNIIKLFSKQRSTKYGATSILGVVIFIAILVIINILSYYNSTSYDLTKGDIYSFSDQTIKVINNLKADVVITAFFKKNSREQKSMEAVLTKYTDISDKIKYEFIDQDLQPTVARQYKVKKLFTTVFESGEKEFRFVFTSNENLEGLITNAIVKVTRGKKKHVYFTKDHGEGGINDQTPAGFSFMKEQLEGINYIVDEVSFLKIGKIPDDCDVLVIADPKKPFLENELALLDEYVSRNGKFVFLVDVDADKTIIDYLAKYGIHINYDIIIDKSMQIFGGDFSRPLISDYHKDHPITKGFTQPALMSVARSIAYTLPFEPWRTYKTIAKTNPYPSVWGETNVKDMKNIKYDKDEDGKGPLDVVGLFIYDSALEKGDKQVTPVKDENVAEMAIFGDADFASNLYFNYYGNADLFTNTVNYLARELDLIAVSPRKASSATILLSDSQRSLLYYFSIIILPSIVFIVGIAVYLRRRNM